MDENEATKALEVVELSEEKEVRELDGRSLKQLEVYELSS